MGTHPFPEMTQGLGPEGSKARIAGLPADPRGPTAGGLGPAPGVRSALLCSHFESSRSMALSRLSVVTPPVALRIHRGGQRLVTLWLLSQYILGSWEVHRAEPGHEDGTFESKGETGQTMARHSTVARCSYIEMTARKLVGTKIT